MTDPDIAFSPYGTFPAATSVTDADRHFAEGRYYQSTSQRANGNDHTTNNHGARPIHPALPNHVVQALLEQGFTRGLAEALHRNNIAFSLRIWIVDNSGSMAERDGQRLVASSTRRRSLTQQSCSRWRELQDTVEYHVQMAALLQAPTQFRLLNDPGRLSGPQYLQVGESIDRMDEDLARTLSTIHNTSPGGVTPLIGHLQAIRKQIQELEPSLRQTGAKVVIVLATDGIPTDERGHTSGQLQRDFAQALRDLQDLPVWIVVRLCTNDDQVVHFWNRIDKDLELSHEVLDDFCAEGKEIYQYNPWLNYGLPLHRMRELGFYNRVFDLLDERKLSIEELREFMGILLGTDAMNLLPDPQLEWKEFCIAISNLVAQEQTQWNPITRRMEPWINVRRLQREYGGPFETVKRAVWIASIIVVLLAVLIKLFEF